MLSRAIAAAALALLASGELARSGGANGLLAPAAASLALFLLLEVWRARRPIDDWDVFRAGAAAALVYGGIYAKTLQHGFHPLDVDWLGAAEACFDGGMVAVLSLHALRRVGGSAEARRLGVSAWAALALILGGAACVYAAKTAFLIYRAERLLGPAWALSDGLFACAAWALIASSKTQSAEPPREAWLRGLAALAIWLPGARLAGRISLAWGLPDGVLYAVAGMWTAVVVLGFRRIDSAPAPGSRAPLAALAWRSAVAVALLLALGRGDARAEGLFAACAGLPTRVLFAWAFSRSRLDV